MLFVTVLFLEKIYIFFLVFLVNLSTIVTTVTVLPKNQGVYLEGEGIDDLAQLMRLGIKGRWAMEEVTPAEHYPARF